MTLLHLLLLHVSSVILGAGPDLSYLSEIWGPPQSFTVARLIEQTIFAKITPETTPQMFTDALENLARLCQRFEVQLDLFHYAAISGSHQCVRDVYEDARARLENLRIMQPPPKPVTLQPLRTAAEVLEAVDATIHLRPDATTFGTEEDIPDDRSPR